MRVSELSLACSAALCSLAGRVVRLIELAKQTQKSRGFEIERREKAAAAWKCAQAEMQSG